MLDKKSGKVMARHVQRATSDTIRRLVVEGITTGQQIVSDKANFYNALNSLGYKHYSIDHSNAEYVSKDGHTTNSIESFWSRLKRGIKGSNIWVSAKWLFNYLNEYVFRFNWRKGNVLEEMLRLIYLNFRG